MIDKLLYDYVNAEPRERKKGRYYSSEISGIIKNYIKPQNFYKQKVVDKRGVHNVLSGSAFESQLKKILEFHGKEFEHEPKKELKVKDFVIVVKPDFVFADKIIETKLPIRLGTPEDYLERYKHQMETQWQAFKKPVFLGIFKFPFDLQVVEYKPSPKTWKEIQEKLAKFHSQVPEPQKDTKTAEKGI